MAAALLDISTQRRARAQQCFRRRDSAAPTLPPQQQSALRAETRMSAGLATLVVWHGRTEPAPGQHSQARRCGQGGKKEEKS